jgi:PD-(D/E)XK endonuclease
MLTTDQKGAIAEAAIAAAAVKLDIGVYRPLTVERYDLIFDLRPELVRVQCKWAARHGDVLVVSCRRCRRGRDGFVRRRYTADEVDAIAAYCLELDRCYFLPLDRFPDRSGIYLRLAPTKNNQRLAVNWADEFAFEATLGGLLGP